MKALWVCNIVLPEYASEFGLKPTVIEGWITGMLHQMEKKLEIAFCFPVIDLWRAKDGELNAHKYYSFPYSSYEYSEATKERFVEIIKDYKPDIIHVWGTEYPHTLSVINACEYLGLLDAVVINIQGLVEPCSMYYLDHILSEDIGRENERGDSLLKGQQEFELKGKFEREALGRVKYVIGRTDWDYAWVKHVNRDIIYYFAGEILRDEFYEIDKKWSYISCQKHTIFVSQAGYAIKGLDYLLRALPDLLKDYPNIHINVAGTNPILPSQRTGYMTPYGIYLDNLIKRMSLQDNISFLGRLNSEEMIEMYRRANVFVSCSRIENSPNSICEAALVGTPIVASYVGGVESLARKISNIYLYQPGAEYMMAFFIRKIFQTDKFVIDSREIERLLDREKNAEATWQVYQNMRMLKG